MEVKEGETAEFETKNGIITVTLIDGEVQVSTMGILSITPKSENTVIVEVKEHWKLIE